MDIVMTGDRPTGPLHLGHYAGSLLARLDLQKRARQFVMIADIQALTDNADNPDKVSENVLEVMLDYLAVGIDPKLSTIYIQSQLPQIAELTIFYLNLVTWNRLKHNPTVKQELRQKNFGDSVPAGFMTYPVSQAADISIMRANLVPVGEDQRPMLEQTNELVRTFNRLYGETLVECEIVNSRCARLPGIDGDAKMSKSLNNAIYLKDDADTLQKKVKKMYTDPDHLRVEDPGKIEGNTVFTYLDVFDSSKEKVEELKAHYQRGGLGDMVVKKYLMEVLEGVLGPIRKKREEYNADRGEVMRLLREGTLKAQEQAQKTLDDVKSAMKLNYFDMSLSSSSS